MNAPGRVAGLVLALVMASTSSASRLIGFEADAFNRAFPASFGGNCVFSPFSFEIDCVLVAETLDTIKRANVSETLGVLIDFDSVYQPILAEYAVRTNGFRFVAARGFCVAEPEKALSSSREQLYQSYGMAVCRRYPINGALAWFHTAMDGEAEDFSIDIDAARGNRYAFYDVVSFRCSWLEPFPTANTRKLTFNINANNRREIEFMSDVRKVDAVETVDSVLLRLPLKNGADFYAMMPKGGAMLGEIRGDMSSVEIDRILSVTKSLTERGVYHGPAVVALPKFAMTTQVNLQPIMTYFLIPTKGLSKIAGDAIPSEMLQSVRFRLDEQGLDATPLREKPEAEVVRVTSDTRKYIFNRPFLFFVYHEATRSIPVAGQFTGLQEP